MDYLVDTNVLLWFLSGDRKLDGLIIQKIENPRNSVFYSVASIWEIAIKYNLKKLTLNVPFGEFYPRRIERNGFLELPITSKALLLISEMPKIHNDPFDRLIFAHAWTENMELLFTDVVFNEYFEFYKQK